MTPVNHFKYQCSVFSYTSFPTVIIEIDCFREDGTQSNCYKYNFTWANATYYNQWLVIARSLTISGTTAERLTGMFDALNLFLKQSPKTLNGTQAGTWTQTARFNGPCPNPISYYFNFAQTTGDFLDNVASVVLPRNGWVSTAGLIGEAVTTNPLTTTGTQTGAVFPYSTSNVGFSIWGWVNTINLSATVQTDFGIISGSSIMAFEYFWNGGATYRIRTVGSMGGLTTTKPITANVWVFLAVVYTQATNTAELFIDAASATSGPAGSGGPITANYAAIMNSGSASNTGLFTEWGCCMAVAASPGQITALYNGGAGVTWPAVQAIF